MKKKSGLPRAFELLAGGDWHGAHEIVQDESSSVACWAHGIVHIMEGDISNARYWYRQAKRPFPSEPSVENEIQALKLEIGRKRA
jgi:hypothetical protein